MSRINSIFFLLRINFQIRIFLIKSTSEEPNHMHYTGHWLHTEVATSATSSYKWLTHSYKWKLVGPCRIVASKRMFCSLVLEF